VDLLKADEVHALISTLFSHATSKDAFSLKSQGKTRRTGLLNCCLREASLMYSLRSKVRWWAIYSRGFVLLLQTLTGALLRGAGGNQQEEEATALDAVAGVLAGGFFQDEDVLRVRVVLKYSGV